MSASTYFQPVQSTAAARLSVCAEPPAPSYAFARNQAPLPSPYTQAPSFCGCPGKRLLRSLRQVRRPRGGAPRQRVVQRDRLSTIVALGNRPGRRRGTSRYCVRLPPAGSSTSSTTSLVSPAVTLSWVVRAPTFAVTTVETASVPTAVTSNPLPLATTLTQRSVVGEFDVARFDPGGEAVGVVAVDGEEPLGGCIRQRHLPGRRRQADRRTEHGHREPAARAWPFAAVTMTSPARRPVTTPWLVTARCCRSTSTAYRRPVRRSRHGRGR